MKLTKTFMTMLTAGMLALSTQAIAQDKGTIGISMPTKSSARWIADGDNMVKVFTELGYGTDLQYAEDDIPNQLAQIENMVTKGVKVLVIAAIDGTTLSAILQQAHDSGVKVIAYDRLIRDSANVDYYATFDNFQVGVLQAGSIVDGLGLKDGKGPFNIELFGGSPDDNNAFFFYDGAMSVLQPYIDSKKLVVQSGQMGMDKVGTLRWDGAVAQARMDNLLERLLRRQAGGRGALAVRRPLHRHPVVAEGRRLRLRRSADADRQRPGRRSALDQVDDRRRAVFDRVQGHARARQGHGQHGRRPAGRQGSAGQRHQDL